MTSQTVVLVVFYVVLFASIVFLAAYFRSRP